MVRWIESLNYDPSVYVIGGSSILLIVQLMVFTPRVAEYTNLITLISLEISLRNAPRHFSIHLWLSFLHQNVGYITFECDIGVLWFPKVGGPSASKHSVSALVRGRPLAKKSILLWPVAHCAALEKCYSAIKELIFLHIVDKRFLDSLFRP
jgi:hypothetical protein